MIKSLQSSPLELSRKINSLSCPNNSEPSESSTGESQFKDETNEEKDEIKIKNKKNLKKKNYNNLLNKKVKRFNFQSPNKKHKNINENKNNIINNIFNEFKSTYSLYYKFPQFNQVEKNLKNGFYASSQELARDFRSIFSNLFSSSLTKLDSDKYNKIFILSEIFENIFEKHEKNSQIKMAQKLSDELARLKKEINKLTRHRKNKTGDVSQVSNLEEKNEKSNDNIREDIISKINRLNSEQKKGILDIISDNLVNKNCEHNIIELDINKLPLNQLKKLDIYINKCINDNININSNIKRQNVEKESDLIQNDELSISSSCLSDSEDSESFELE